MLIANILFYAFAGVLLFSALMVVSARNPVHSVLFLILAFFNASGLFLLLGAEFIAMLLVIVYVGAVAVLFLFIVMMLNVNFAELRSGFKKYLPVGLAAALLMLAELLLVIKYSVSGKAVTAVPTSPMTHNLSNTEMIGTILYTQYSYPFQLAGLILLVAMIGAITLAHRTREGVRKQSIRKQVSRSRLDGVELVKVQSRRGV